jgi:hypothetical protein
MTKQRTRTAGILIGMIACALTATVAAESVGRVKVMEVDQTRGAASVSLAKAKNRSQRSENQDENGGFSSSGGCSDMNIGNVVTGPGQRVPRNVTIVIEGPVIQENKCR